MGIDKKLKLYIVSSVYDKKPVNELPCSSYEVHIQAGAALTDRRICPLNDMDDCPDNISNRNRRYSEGTAIFWIYKHPDTEYVGIEHYRRRFALTQNDYSKLIDDGIDIITTTPINIGEATGKDSSTSIEANYRQFHYAADWDLFMDILKKHHPEDYELAINTFSGTMFHPCNINVFRRELFCEYSDWLFPMCDEFYHLSPEKTDVYQHRDVSFIMERLSHLFVVKMCKTGKKIKEAPLIQFETVSEEYSYTFDINNPEDVFEACNDYFRAGLITKANELLYSAMLTYAGFNEKLNLLYRLFVAYLNERRELHQTMFEYLPPQFRSDLNILTQIWSGFEQAVSVYHSTGSKEALDKLTQYMELTGFSKSALRTALVSADTFCSSDRI